MRILVIDSYAESVLDWILRCEDDGHEVKWHFTATPRNEQVGRGLATIVRDFRGLERWPDLVFMTDNTKYVRELEGWRKRGVRIVGPNPEGAAWELDRDCGMKALKRAGIAVPPSKEFNDYDAAIAYVKREGARFVSKPCGVEGDKALSYVSKDAADLVFQLEKWKRAGKLKGSFVLQEHVSGVEFGVGGWFGPGGWNDGWEENVEHKKLFPGELGPNTGEMGTAMWFTRSSKLARKVLLPLTDQLERMDYVGCVDVNVIVDERGTPWPLEFTMRPGWPSFNIQQTLVKGDHAEWLYDLAEGIDARAFVYDQVAVGAVLCLPDLPYDLKPVAEVAGVPLYGITDELLPNLHPCMMQRADAPQMSAGKVTRGPMLCAAGTYVAVVTGTGKTVLDARRMCYGNLDQLSMPASPFYRNDIGLKLKKNLPLLQEHGYAKGIDYGGSTEAARETAEAG